MSESPKSEKYMFLTRYSTPVPELDDHRFQLDPPRMEATPDVPLSRQDTAPQGLHPETPQRPDLLGIQDALREAGSFSRDFEQAIVDEDRSVKDLTALGRRFSVDLTGNVRHGRTYSRTHQDYANLSRESSVSARSTSPPNSVEAFADPRRRERANTLESHGAPDLEAILQRTVSGGTHHRRPTFSNASVIRPQPGDAQLEPTDNGCVPNFEQPGRIPVIDYEELEEFVALSQQAKPTTSRRKHSLSSQSKKPRIFYDLRPGVHSFDSDGTKRSSSGECSSEEVSDLSPGKNEKLFTQVSHEKELLENMKNENEPTRFGFFSSESQSTVHAAELGDLVLPGDSFRDLFQLGPEGGVWWLDVLNPTEDEVGALSRAFSIHPLTTEDILTQEAREKVELFKQYYFVCFRTFYQMDKTSEEFMEPVNFYMVVFRDGVLSFSFTENPHAANVRKRIGKLRDYVSLSSDWICYAMIFGPVIREIEIESEAIEDLVFIARMDDFESFLPRIGGLRKKVMSLMRLLGGKADVIRGFSKRCNEQYSVTPRGDIGLYLGDIQDHVVTMMSNLAHFEKMLSRSHTNYLAQLNVTNLMLGNHVNKVLSKVTLIATMLVPMNLICGLFGMNVEVPGQHTESLAWFFGIIGVIGAIIIISGSQGTMLVDDVDARFEFPLASYNGLEFEDVIDQAGDHRGRGLDLVRRAPAGVSSLGNNQYQEGTLSLGETQHWYFSANLTSDNSKNGTSDTSSAKRSNDFRQRSTAVYLSLTACSKPSLKMTDDATTSTTVPQLQVFVSLSDSLEQPGPNKDSAEQQVFVAEEGYLGTTLAVDGNLYVGVTAPNNTHYSGSYTYQIAVSTDAFFHSVDNEIQLLYLVDTDTKAALFTTKNLTDTDINSQEISMWMNKTPPYTMFANNLNNTAVLGLERSFCALERLAQIGMSDVETSMTTRGNPHRPKEQLYVTGLNRSSTYLGILAQYGNSTSAGNGIIGGGGKVWMSMNFTTKADNNCAVVYGLPFCSEVAYAVPWNSSTQVSALRTFYDDHAASLYQNFSYSLQQIQCNASNESMFSLAVSCGSCAEAYKQWLCAVTIPRCQDFSSTDSFLQTRNAAQPFLNGTSITNSSLLTDPTTNKSRNSLIDTYIRPGPYKEILPCQEVCHNLVRNCPSALGFSCPVGRWLNSSYGVRDPSGDITCNYLGAAYYLNTATGIRPYAWDALFALTSFWTALWALS
ncbi:magnesium transporter CorA family protein [Aspergillus saccharolyticus JOP 1030-1]|uniref:Putative cora family metal ion transporter n=1 Tax=Aspergillus saccharolyticus JOP 1030-1 TaxID=1450539 RepID=A0A318Z2Y5_9EURO|nr:putative cora family metal ion transporter [Aspergillus saccharolyticus JOP 1030-1]PYH40657.1 putative cora family metal ion transporter [Aspergillus saccharolyticus JOP 1030-1]